MAVNKYQRHILFLPEDAANVEILNGIQLKVPFANQRKMQILPPCGGWMDVKKKFEAEYITYLENYSGGYVVMVVDFDGKENRAVEVKESVPYRLLQRVFVFGSLNEPEEIKLGSLENVGKKLAQDCISATTVTWDHEAFFHNASELARFRETVCEILF